MNGIKGASCKSRRHPLTYHLLFLLKAWVERFELRLESASCILGLPLLRIDRSSWCIWISIHIVSILIVRI